MKLLRDRRDAGRRLARALSSCMPSGEIVVLALPRGGVPVAAAIAAEINAPLDVFIVRKLGAPGQPELAFGAVAGSGVRVLNDDIVVWLGLTEQTIEEITARERAEMARREMVYRRGRAARSLTGKTVILVDDGLATGATMLAAVQALKEFMPAYLVVAVPVAPAAIRAALENAVDRVVCLATPEPFYGVGDWYADFEQITDDEVCAMLTGEFRGFRTVSRWRDRDGLRQ